MKILVRALAALALSIAAHAALAQDQQQTPAQPQATQTPQSADGKAVVIVYRPGKFAGRALEPSVFCDKVEVARMDNGRYFVLLLEPGEHRVHMTEEYKRVDLKLGAGEVAFVRFRLDMNNFAKARGTVYLADEEDAAKDLKKMKPLGADKIRDTALVADKERAEALLKKYVP
jgi:glucose/arabinose dehydrogenase